MTAMLDLALHNHQAPVTLADIARRQDISLTYLEQLLSKLRRNQLVESVRGPGGGYRLAQNAGNITIAKIMYAVDESVDITRCGGQQNCQEDQRCLSHDLWMELNLHIAEFLNRVTLDEMMHRNNVRQVSARQDNFLIQCR